MRNIEGFSRRRSQGDIRRDLREQEAETNARQVEKERQEIVAGVHTIDAEQKVLTGRHALDYAEESGVPYTVLFPEGAEILNIGDPWQTLDLPGVTTIDYEYGEEAEFVTDPVAFLVSAPEQLALAATTLSQWAREQGENQRGTEGRFIAQELRRLGAAMPEARSLGSFPAFGDRLLAAAKRISAFELREKQDGKRWASVPLAEDKRKQAWIKIDRLGRGFHDAHLTLTVIEPAIRQAALERHGLTKPQEDQLRRELIEAHRFHRKTEHADIRKGTFPDVPLPDHSFDRLVASWSISAHLFPELKPQQFAHYWEEIHRLLKKDGVAVIWPIYRGNEEALAKSLKEYARLGGDACVLPFSSETSDNNEPVFVRAQQFQQAIGSASALLVFPKGMESQEKARFIQQLKQQRMLFVSGAGASS
ncbi:class I SAM-dependent methyltransferase [Candidatus Uhrbacteria bacterium]|nr:class I SAM-dependent methyltransferase [Candidatus Uhrbacteria bacterium]